MSRPVERLETGVLAVYNTGSNQIYFDLAPGQELDKAGVQITPDLIADFTPLDLRRVTRPLLGLEVINAADLVWPVISLDSFEDASTPGIALPESGPEESRINVRQVLAGLRRMAGLARLIPEDIRYAAREPEVIKTARIPAGKVLQIAERIILGVNEGQQVSGLGQMVLDDLRSRVQLDRDRPVAPILPPTFSTALALGQSRPARLRS